MSKQWGLGMRELKRGSGAREFLLPKESRQWGLECATHHASPDPDVGQATLARSSEGQSWDTKALPLLEFLHLVQS